MSEPQRETKKSHPVGSLVRDAGAALFVAMLLASLTAAGIINMMLAYILLTVAWVVGVVSVVARESVHERSRWVKIRAGSAAGLALAVLLAGVGWYETEKSPKETAPFETAGLSLMPKGATSTHSAPKNQNGKTPKTLSDLYESDFPNSMRLSKTITILFKKQNQTFDIIAKEYVDFDANNKYLGFLLPAAIVFGWDYTTAVCQYLADNSKSIISDIENGIGIAVSVPGNSNLIRIRDLTFSGRVYVYYEGTLDLQQKAGIDSFYRKRGLMLQLRGMDYLASRLSSIPNSH